MNRTKKILFAWIAGLFMLAGSSVFAGVITLNRLEVDSGSAKDANGDALTISGFTTDSPSDVTSPAGGPYVYTQRLTVEGVDLDTGLSGGTGSVSFDLTYSSTGSKLDFRAGWNVLLANSQPLTVTIGNFSYATFDDWNYVRGDVAEGLNVYEGIGTGGTLLQDSVVGTNKDFNFSSAVSAVTLTLDSGVGQLEGVGFDLNVTAVPEPTTIGLFGVAAAGLFMARRARRI